MVPHPSSIACVFVIYKKEHDMTDNKKHDVTLPKGVKVYRDKDRPTRVVLEIEGVAHIYGPKGAANISAALLGEGMLAGMALSLLGGGIALGDQE